MRWLVAALAAWSVGAAECPERCGLVSWVAPQQNVDGSELTDLVDYQVHRRCDSAASSVIATVPAVRANPLPADGGSYNDQAPLGARCFYSVTARNATQASVPSGEASKGFVPGATFATYTWSTGTPEPVPTVTIGLRAANTFSGMEDAVLHSTFPTNNLPNEGSSDEDFVLRATGLSNITGPVTVTDAFFTLNVTSGGGPTTTVSVRRLLRAWVENQATYNIYSTGNSWTTAGAGSDGNDRVATVSAELDYPGGFETGDFDTTSNATLIADVEGMINGTLSNNGWLFSGASGIALGLPGGTDETRPFLTVTYELATSTDQEGFRWGVDDDNEASHGWEAAQDTDITIADTQARLLRLLIDAEGDLPSAAYTLRYQKNGSGGYTVVPVGATTTTSPPSAPTATVTTIGTAADPWTINRSPASTGDMVVFVLAWDDSTNVTSVAAPSGPNGETAQSIAGPVASNGTEMRMQAWYYIATGAWSAGTLSFNPSASETVRAVSFTIPAGQFNAADPIGFANTTASAGTAESTLNSPTGTAEGDDGSGRLYIAYGSDADAITPPASGTSTIDNATGGGVGLCVVSRDTLVSNGESISNITASITSDSWASLAFVVKPKVTNNEVFVDASANIASGGEDTTARLTPPSGKTTGNFTTGRRWDNENGSDSIDIEADEYTELEWKVALSATPSDADYFEFRVYSGSNALDTYSVTPKWTVGAAPTLAAEGGSYVLTGADVALTRSLSMTASSGAYALAGADIALNRGYYIAAESGSYSLAGSDVTLTRALVLAANSGAYSLTGTDVDLIRSLVIAANSGAYVLTGADVELTHEEAGAFTLEAEAGSYVITGSDAGLVRSLIVAADSGSYLLTGADVTLTYTPAGEFTLTAESGSYVLTGADVALTRSLLMAAAAGAYSLVGADVTLTYTPAGQFSLAAESGSYRLTGSDAQLIRSLLISAASGSYTLSGADVVLGYGRVMSAESGAYALTGSDIATVVARALIAASGSYVISGASVGLLASGVPIIGLNPGVVSGSVRRDITSSGTVRSVLSSGVKRSIIN